VDVSTKPRLRGVFHQYAFFVALVAGVVLVAVSDSGRELSLSDSCLSPRPEYLI